MRLPIRRSSVAALCAALTLAACEGAPTGAALSADQAPPALDVSHICSPFISGPSSLAVSAQGTYTLNYYNTNSGCTNPSVSWSVTNGAQVVSTSSVSAQLTAPVAAGSAVIKAGQCDFDVIASSTYNGNYPTTSSKRVLVRDCTPLSVSLSAGSSPYGAIKLTWNAVRADSFRVYRKVIPRAGGTDPGFSYRGTSTGTMYTDIGYRLSNRFDYEFNIWYKVEAYDSYGLLTQHTVYTWAEDNQDDM